MITREEAFKEIESHVHAWTCYDANRLGLPGLKVGIKDIINTIDFPTRRGSPIYKDYKPGNDARIVSMLKQAGCVIVGKTTTAEFGVHHLYDDTKNPYDSSRTPGTSSTGSAVAVATGQVPVAIGTQSGGSVIRPASYCGVRAFKPSFGLIPRTGILKTADTLDTVGIFGDTVKHILDIFNIISLQGEDYAISIKPASGQPLRKKCCFWHPLFNEALEIHRKIYHKSLSYYFRKEIEQYPDLVSDIFKAQVEEGNNISLTEYKQLLKRQQSIAFEIENELFDDIDILICDSSSGPAPYREIDREVDSCPVWTLLGFPVINIPERKINGLPWGTQLVARKYEDYSLLKFALEIEGEINDRCDI